jgi:hypothetical protein
VAGAELGDDLSALAGGAAGGGEPFGDRLGE